MDNRFNNWNTSLQNPWEDDWFTNQHQSFATNHYNNTNNFNGPSASGVNFSRSNRSKNLREKSEHRTADRNFGSKSQNEPNTSDPVDKAQKKNLKCSKDTPSTVTSSSSVQPCSSNSIEKTPEPIAPNVQDAEQVTKKLIHQLTSMNKHNLKQMINNPSSKYETALQTHARNRMRAEMRTKLQNMSSNQENQLVNNVLETEESVDMDKIPDNVFDEIGRVLDINLLGQEDNSNNKYNDSDDKDKPMEYPMDIFARAEQLLMHNCMFLEERQDDRNSNNADGTSIKIKNEIKEEPDDIGDENFFEIQESGTDNFSLSDLVFEDREGTENLRNDNFVDQLQETTQTNEDALENCEPHMWDGNRVEMVLLTSLIVKEEEDGEVEHYKQTNNNNERGASPNSCSKASSQTSSPLYKSPNGEKAAECSSTTNNHKAFAADDFHTNMLTNANQLNRESDIISNKIATATATQEPPKKNDLFTKLQNSGAFESSSVRRRCERNLESSDYRRDSPYSRKKKKKHKSRSRSISRSMRSRSRSPSRSRNSHRSKKDRERSRKRNVANPASDNVKSIVTSSSVESSTTNIVATTDLSNDSLFNQIEVNDEFSNKSLENVEVEKNENLNKTDESAHMTTEVSSELTNIEMVEIESNEEILIDQVACAAKCTTESITDNQMEAERIEMDVKCPTPTNFFTDFSEQIDVSVVDKENEDKSMESDSIKPLVSDDIMDIVMDSVNAADIVHAADIIATSLSIPNIDQSADEVLTLETVSNSSPASNSCPTFNSDLVFSPTLPLDTINDTNVEKDILVEPVEPPTGASQAVEIIAEESSTSIGSQSIEEPIMLNSECQSFTSADCTPKANQPEKNNVAAITKLVLKPSSRHQKSSSKHKCDKERHASSSHKSKKSEASSSSSSSKKFDPKDDLIHSTNMAKHSQSEQPQRPWRSAGEKKCIEPSKSTLRSIDIFDPLRPAEALKVVD
ncbi:hypothetical protein Bhyg_12939, partial [Pseudolycoriella hygida]